MYTRLRKSLDKKDQGFTLIELLVVIIIIGILAAIAIPVFLKQREKGIDAGVKSDLRNAATAQETYITDNPTTFGSPTAAALTTAGFKKTGTNVIEYQVIATPVGSQGYCLRGYNTGGSAKGGTGTFFFYDSAAGGLALAASDVGPTGGACAAVGATWVTTS